MWITHLSLLAKLCDEFFRRESNGKLGDIISEEKKSTIQVETAKDLNGEYPFFISGDAVLSCDKPLVNNRPIYIPNEIELKAFNSITMPAYTTISYNQRENRALIALRDWLLPTMLMNGQATIED